MKIHFFEEYPTEENLEKTQKLQHPAILYMAARSLQEFFSYREQLYKINPNIQAAYWPILERSYWISPFSHPADLQKLLSELEEADGEGFPVLFDLELPILKPSLFFRHLRYVRKNKKLLRQLFYTAAQSGLSIATAEYPIANRFVQNLLKRLGVSFPVSEVHHHRIVMYYSSIIRVPWLLNKVKKYIATEVKKPHRTLQVGLGTIATGVFGNEPILEPEALIKDLEFCKEQEIQDVVIFRLGGLTEEYLQIIHRFDSSAQPTLFEKRSSDRCGTFEHS